MIDCVLPSAGMPPLPHAAMAAAPAAPCVVARCAADARLAASAGLPFTLLSARAAACFAGCLLWQAIAREARAACPALVGADILDCADAPGRALEALRLGQRILVLDADAPGFVDVCGRAAAIGATVLPERPPHFDWGLVAKPTPHLLARLRTYLETATFERVP